MAFFSCIAYGASCAFVRDCPALLRLKLKPLVKHRQHLSSSTVRGSIRAYGTKDDIVDETHEARNRSIYRFLEEGGYEKDPFVVGKLVNPALTEDGPTWPNLCQAHQVLRRRGGGDPANPGGSRVLIVSAGLSDPCTAPGIAPAPGLSGFGYEVVGEFRSSTEGDDGYSGSFQPFGTWEVLVADQISQQVAGSQARILEWMDEWGATSGEVLVPDSWNCPDHLVNHSWNCPDHLVSQGTKTMAYLLFWSRAPWLPTTTSSGDDDSAAVAGSLSFPAGSARLLCFRIITPSQLATILEASGDDLTRQRRNDLVKGWEADGSHHITNIQPPKK